MKTKFKMMIAAAAVVFGGSASGLAHAVPVNEFFYSQNAGWLNPETDGNLSTYTNPSVFTGAPGTTFTLSMENPSGPLAPASTFNGMRWTDRYGVSSAIHVNTYSDSTNIFGDTNSNGEWNAGEYWAISTLRQENRVITGSFPNPLWVADISANLRIFSDAARTNGVFSDLNHNTEIAFWETSNTIGPCPSPAPLGSKCDDIYTISLFTLASQSFFYDGNWYTLNYTLVPGEGALVCTSATDPGCDAASAPPAGKIAVYTREGTDSLIHVAMAWQVPEPSMLSLVGLALLGLGFATRRRRSI